MVAGQAWCEPRLEDDAWQREARIKGVTTASLLENRAREIGIAIWDPSSLTIKLAQWAESGRSAATCSLLLSLYDVHDTILVDGSARRGHSGRQGASEAPISASLQAITASLPGTQFLLPRAAFDDTKGLLALERVSTPDTWSKVSRARQASSSHGSSAGLYLAFGAAGALLDYLQSHAQQALLSGSLRLEIVGTSAHLQLDAGSIESLGILPQPLPGSGASFKPGLSALGGVAAGRGNLQPAGGQRNLRSRGEDDEGEGGPTRSGPVALGQGPPHAGTNFRPHLQHCSLFHLLNRTRTAAGARLLRGSLLQPLITPEAIELRYDAVGELLDSREMAADVGQVLAMLPKNLDGMCSSLVMRPSASTDEASGSRGPGSGARKDPCRRIAAMVSGVLLLRSALQLLPSLAAALGPAEATLLQAVKGTCEHDQLASLLVEVDKVVDPEAQPSNSPFINRIQQCFAVKPGADQMLDVARSTFCRITDKVLSTLMMNQVHALAEQLHGEVQALNSSSSMRAPSSHGRGLPDKHQQHEEEALEDGDEQWPGSSKGKQKGKQGGGLQVKYNNTRGFYLVIPQPTDKNGNPQDVRLPRSFLSLEKRGRTALLCTTHELNALNARLKDAAHDCLLLTEKALEGLVAHLVSHMPLLLRLVDNVALLDMLLAFADTCASAAPDQPYVRPQLHRHGHTLAIVQGRHPLLERRGQASYQPNDTHVDSLWSSLHLVTGPNMAGKSTYLRQVGLLVVMAQAGCYVPAEFMALRPYTSLFTRMSARDCIETNSSSFMVEMQEMAHILDNAGPRSLVLVDELGRATSTLDGTAIAWAVAEALLAAHAPTLFATHLTPLFRLPECYPTARLWQLQVDTTAERMDFKWMLQPVGSEAAPAHYGLRLAASVGFPEDLIKHATEIAEQVAAQEDEQCILGGVLDEQEPAAPPEVLQQVLSFGGKLSTLAYRCLEVLEAEGLVQEQSDTSEADLVQGVGPSSAGAGAQAARQEGNNAPGAGTHQTVGTTEDCPAPMDAEMPALVVEGAGERIGGLDSDMLQLSAQPAGVGRQLTDNPGGGAARSLDEHLWQQLGNKQQPAPARQAGQCLTPPRPTAQPPSCARTDGPAVVHGATAAADGDGQMPDKPDSGASKQQGYMCTADTACLLAVDAVPALMAHLHHLQQEAGQLLSEHE